MAKTVFETKACSRCGGSGRYSYCQTHGSTCFGCGGSGQTLTKRGKAASLFLRSLRTVKGADVKLGDCVLVEGVAGFSRATYVRVDSMYTRINSCKSLQPDGSWKSFSHLHLDGVTPKGERYGVSTFPDMDVRLVPTRAVAAEQVAKALAFQATLTQAGTVNKARLAAKADDEAKTWTVEVA